MVERRTIADLSEPELLRRISANEKRAEWSAGAVILGLVGEIAVILFMDDAGLWKKAAEIGADALIALGVAGEVLFARKERSASEELRRRADLKIADANQRAAEAQLALERYKAPRMLDREQQAEMSTALARYKGIKVNLVKCGDVPEIAGFCGVLATVLAKAGWDVNPMQGDEGKSVEGVHVLPREDVGWDVRNAADKLVTELKRAGVAAQIGAFYATLPKWAVVQGDMRYDPASVRIDVGYKPQ